MTIFKTSNISAKSDIGTSAFTYGNHSRPYALTGVTSSTGVIAPATQTIGYSSFEKVTTISEGDYAASFTYNAEQQRARMEVTLRGTNILTRWYAGGNYMKETAGSVTKEYTYLGGDAYSAPVVAVKQGGTTTYYYLLRDHLGNITHQVNTSNSVVAEYSFDAWGRRRNPNDWSYNLAGQPELFADRGFTGHEYLKWFNLYNMNGRLYDPVVGRFLSPDPFIQDPSNTQNYNRYSYCLNNPLKYSDPTGYKTLWDKFWDWTAKYDIQFGINMGPRGITPNVSAPGPGNTRMAVGYNMQTERVGFGNNSSGFMQFYFPQMNFNYAEQNSENSVLKAKPSRFFSDETAAYNYMWKGSNLDHKEYTAIITTKGIIACPTTWNDENTAPILEYFKVNNKDDGIYVYYNIRAYRVIGAMHTHQNPKMDFTFSKADYDYTKNLNGMPLFRMSYNNTIGGAYWGGGVGNNTFDLSAYTRDDLLSGKLKLIPYILNYGN